MRKTYVSPKIMKLLKTNLLLEKLSEISDNLDFIERQLEDFLEVKRSSFPRFYFLSNDELLEILAKASKLEVTPNLNNKKSRIPDFYLKKK
jgi:dynein heavy chain, axonemal